MQVKTSRKFSENFLWMKIDIQNNSCMIHTFFSTFNQGPIYYIGPWFNKIIHGNIRKSSFPRHYNLYAFILIVLGKQSNKSFKWEVCLYIYIGFDLGSKWYLKGGNWKLFKTAIFDGFYNLNLYIFDCLFDIFSMKMGFICSHRWLVFNTACAGTRAGDENLWCDCATLELARTEGQVRSKLEEMQRLLAITWTLS